jgi:hypothetical protein
MFHCNENLKSHTWLSFWLSKFLLRLKTKGYSFFLDWPFEAEAYLNNIYEFSPYLQENTTLHHYKDQFVNAV